MNTEARIGELHRLVMRAGRILVDMLVWRHASRSGLTAVKALIREVDEQIDQLIGVGPKDKSS